MDVKKEHFPLAINDVEADIANEIMKLFKGELTGFVRVGPKGYFLPNRYKVEASKIYNMPIRADDIFVASYPRSGTTWTQELVWMVANDLDYKGSDRVPLAKRYACIDNCLPVHPEMQKKFEEENGNSEYKLKLLESIIQPVVDQLANTPSPRFVKTHLPLSLLPPSLLDTAKLVYVARDPRDVVVSMFHLNQLLRTLDYTGDFETFWYYFSNDLHHWTPYFEHIKEAWEKKDHPNLLFIFYEDLANDLSATIRRVSNFFNKQYTDDQIAQLCAHLNIENFKKNKSINAGELEVTGVSIKREQSFIRKGKAGGWRDYFDENLKEQAECWIKKNLQNTDLRFPSINKQRVI